MNRTPIEIDINEWEKFGGGFTADSFYKKNDDNLMLKLYADFMPKFEGYKELLVTEQVAALGLPTAKAISYVQTGDRYGAIFERIKNKRSIARLLSEEPDRLDEMAQAFAVMVKNLHSTQCDTDVFVDLNESIERKVKKSPFLEESQKRKALEILSTATPATTCVHGDCHIGNVIITEGREPMWIDLADFSYGSPEFDLGTMIFNVYFIPDGMCRNLYHISGDLMKEFWEHFVKYYFDGESLESVNKRIMPFAAFQAVHFADKNGRSDEVLDSIFNTVL